MSIDGIIQAAWERTLREIEDWTRYNQPDGECEKEARYIGTMDIEIIRPDKDDVQAFKDDLKWLLLRIDEERRIDAAYEILQLYMKRVRHNEKYDALVANSEHFRNFNKPERDYDARIKAAETVLRSLPDDGSDDAIELRRLLGAYIAEQQTGDNERIGSYRILKIARYPKKQFIDELREILKRYDVYKIGLRYIQDHLD